MRRLMLAFAAALALLLLPHSHARADGVLATSSCSGNTVQPGLGANLLTDLTGQLCTNGTFTGSITATTTATATSAPPTYTEGEVAPISQTLGGALRINGSITATTAATSTAAAPTYTEGASSPLSQNLSGGLRVSGTFFQTTQPVSIATLPSLATGSNTIGAISNTGFSVTGGSVGLLGGTQIVGRFGIDQTTQGTTNGVVALTGSTTAVSNFPATQPVSGSVSVSNFPATQSISAASLPLPTGASTSALQPAINGDGGGLAHVTNFPATQPISGTITVAQPTAASLNATIVGTGTLAVQNTASLPSGSATIGALVANQSVNNAQIGGVTVATGNGVSGTGVQRVAIASDNTAFAVSPDTGGSTGSAAPAKASYSGALSSGNLVGLIQADTSTPISVSTATTTQLVALSSGKRIYITSFDLIAGGTGNATFVYGTGTNCGTGQIAMTGAYNLTAQAGIAKGSGLGPVLVVPPSNALCILTSAAVQMSGSVSYTQQ